MEVKAWQQEHDLGGLDLPAVRKPGEDRKWDQATKSQDLPLP